MHDKELSFTKDGKTYVAQWKDIEALYNEDRKNNIHLTKITYTAVYPKPLKRQSMPYVCQIFNNKTAAALSTLKDKLGIIEGTIILTNLNRGGLTVPLLSTVHFVHSAYNCFISATFIDVKLI